MKELDKMTDEELSALKEKFNKEIEKRKKLAKETYQNKYEALCKIEAAFDEYYAAFNELPFIKYGSFEPIRMEMTSCANDTFEYPYLCFYRR